MTSGSLRARHAPLNRDIEANGRATRARVDLDAYEANVRIVRAMLTPGAELMAVVKANGYGHGAVAIAQAAVEAGASQLGVATVAEGRQLRISGLRAPILVLGPIDPGEAAKAFRLGLAIAVGTNELLDAAASAARTHAPAEPAKIHIKVDTGMRRYGAVPELALALARRVTADPTLSLAGFFTHFATADEGDETFTRAQANQFDQCLDALDREHIHPGQRHVANSAATLRRRRYDYDLVRCGIALFGLAPSSDIALPAGLRPVLSVRSRVTRIIDLEPGETVGYGRQYRALGREQAALIPIGYGDGYGRALSGRGWMGIGCRPAPVRGRVAMDQTVVGLPRDHRTAIGDEVVVIASTPEEGAPMVSELADLLGTISYEIVTGLAARIPRLYVRDGRMFADEPSSAAVEAPSDGGSGAASGGLRDADGDTARSLM